MFGTPRSNSQRREISEDRAKLEELRAKCKIREETYKIEIDKLRQKLDKIRHKFEQQHKYRQNSQEMQKLKEENIFLKQQVQYQKNQMQQSFQINSNIYQTSRETSATKRAQSSRSAHDKNQNLSGHANSSGSKQNNLISEKNNHQNGNNSKKIIATDIELVKIAQHRLMKENKSLKKRVDMMQTQMKELYDLLLEEKMNNTQSFQTNQNIHQVIKALKQSTENIQKSPIDQKDFISCDTVPYDQSLQQQTQLMVSAASNTRVSGERSISPIYQSNQNPTYGTAYLEEQMSLQGSNFKQNDISSGTAQGKSNNQNTFIKQNILNSETLNLKSPEPQRAPELINEQQLSNFQDKIEQTKSKFIDKIKNVFQKHQKQNEIFEQKNKQMKEITKQLFSSKSKSKENKNQEEIKLKTQESVQSSVTSSISSAFIVDNESNPTNKQEHKNEQNYDLQSSSQSQNQILAAEDHESTVELQQEDDNSLQKQNQQHFEDFQGYSPAIQKQINLLNQEAEQDSDEQSSADFDYRKNFVPHSDDNFINSESTNYITKKEPISLTQNQAYASQNPNYSGGYKQIITQGSKGNTKSLKNDLNVVSFNDTGQTNFKKDSAKKLEEFKSLKEQFSALINTNANIINNSSVNNNTLSNLNNTTGMTAIANNYLQYSSYAQDGSLTSRKYDTQLQQPKYSSLAQQYNSTQSTINQNKPQTQNNLHPSTLNSNQNNIVHQLDLKKLQDNSNGEQYLKQKYSSNTSRNNQSTQRNGKVLDLEFIGHSTQISPQKDALTSRQRDEMYLNFPSSTHSQTVNNNILKKENTNVSNKIQESKVDYQSKTSKLTTPISSTQNEKITDEYIKQIIQQYKTPKKSSINNQYSQQNQSYQNKQSYQQQQQQPIPQQSNISTQQFMIPYQKKQNLSNQNYNQSYEKKDPLQTNQLANNYLKHQQQPQTSRLYEKDTSLSNQYIYNQNANTSHLGSTGVASNVNTQSSPNRFSKINSSNNNKGNINSTNFNQSSIPQSTNIIPPTSSYQKDLNIYNCYFNNNSPINKKITSVQPPTSTTNKEQFNLNHKRQQSCGGGGVSGVNKYNFKLNLTSLVTPKSSQMLQSDRQNSDRTGYNKLISKNQGLLSSNISPKYSPHSSQTTSANRFYQK
ncbi:hypothetical protein TTHERM_00446330 (macronuclear) [Tetrahymena thermophila SB210]|uniref:Uncharacterized protein n=1 Tax=Tetrahymena thermophila (strain SB210) TaxID=312017 RepID=I7LWZ5_TETTS|nr:hypothetical protein TTHERM_00446330 [Tetrahymena thermophila SB210]EAS03151.2 hypothetical protein TTHERM_00446330 [Tetrahymena thermophila SB210]|eukprot:XP_001023396.2 hypothetical protein TTHERM_00446330 [Tetrahymena thermophila SB210]